MNFGQDFFLQPKDTSPQKEILSKHQELPQEIDEDEE